MLIRFEPGDVLMDVGVRSPPSPPDGTADAVPFLFCIGKGFMKRVLLSCLTAFITVAIVIILGLGNKVLAREVRTNAVTQGITTVLENGSEILYLIYYDGEYHKTKIDITEIPLFCPGQILDIKTIHYPITRDERYIVPETECNVPPIVPRGYAPHIPPQDS